MPVAAQAIEERKAEPVKKVVIDYQPEERKGPIPQSAAA